MGKAWHILTFALWLGLGGVVFGQQLVLTPSTIYIDWKQALTDGNSAIQKQNLPTHICVGITGVPVGYSPTTFGGSDAYSIDGEVTIPNSAFIKVFGFSRAKAPRPGDRGQFDLGYISIPYDQRPFPKWIVTAKNVNKPEYANKNLIPPDFQIQISHKVGGTNQITASLNIVFNSPGTNPQPTQCNTAPNTYTDSNADPNADSNANPAANGTDVFTRKISINDYSSGSAKQICRED